MLGHFWNATLSIQLKPYLKTIEQKSAEQMEYKVIILPSCKEYFHLPILPMRRFECTRGPFQPGIP